MLVSVVQQCESAVSLHVSPPSQVSLGGCLLPPSFLPFSSPQSSGLLLAKVEALFSPLTSKVSPDLPLTWLCLCSSQTHGGSGPHHTGARKRSLKSGCLPSPHRLTPCECPQRGLTVESPWGLYRILCTNTGWEMRWEHSSVSDSLHFPFAHIFCRSPVG